ncbi:Hypothetical predicted protein [Mytilus galloprovincialis]|uniref:B box-type domain-containing protein n=1 Tax=Mytilus galloprovincialis TaxID=29158 RepID=A0A8B6ED82_MYTGA|nr:Hypothetical predicted protein [Mytilus galloprovincialis]
MAGHAMPAICGPCLEGGNKNPSLKWCTICEEQLCSGCVQHHQMLKLTRNHYLTEIRNDASSSYATENKGTILKTPETCVYHPSVKIQFYCKKHDIMLCDACLGSHKSCNSDIVPIDLASNGTKNSQNFHSLQTEITNILQSFSAILANKQTIEQIFSNEVSSAKKKIVEIRLELVRYLEEMIDKTLLMDVESQEKEVLDQLMKDKTVAEDGRKEDAWFLDEMSSILNTGSDKQAFMLLQRMKAFKNVRDQQLKKMSYNMQAYSLKVELTDPVELCSKMELLFGEVIMESTPYNVNMVQGMKISPICAKGESVNTEKYVHSVSIMDAGQLLVVEFNLFSSSKVFLFNDTGGHISDIKIPGTPTDSTTVPGGSKAVVLVDNKKLLFLEKDGTGTLHCKNIMKMAKGCNLITASLSKLYIAYKSEIIVWDINGHDVQYLKTLQMTGGQIQAFSVGRDDDVYYAIADRLYCMKDYGEEICLYQTQDLKDVSGIVLDTEGNVYICGKTSNNIHVLKQKDSSAQVLLRERDGLQKPSGICFDKFRNKLFVYCRCTHDPIQVYNVTM